MAARVVRLRWRWSAGGVDRYGTAIGQMAYKAIFRRNVVIMRLIYINRAWAGLYQAI